MSLSKTLSALPQLTQPNELGQGYKLTREKKHFKMNIFPVQLVRQTTLG